MQNAKATTTVRNIMHAHKHSNKRGDELWKGVFYAYIFALALRLLTNKRSRQLQVIVRDVFKNLLKCKFATSGIEHLENIQSKSKCSSVEGNRFPPPQKKNQFPELCRKV
jgi:hypothetical protein